MIMILYFDKIVYATFLRQREEKTKTFSSYNLIFFEVKIVCIEIVPGYGFILTTYIYSVELHDTPVCL